MIVPQVNACLPRLTDRRAQARVLEPTLAGGEAQGFAHNKCRHVAGVTCR
jgi:hypothetical protein